MSLIPDRLVLEYVLSIPLIAVFPLQLEQFAQRHALGRQGDFRLVWKECILNDAMLLSTKVTRDKTGDGYLTAAGRLHLVVSVLVYPQSLILFCQQSNANLNRLRRPCRF